MVAAGCVPAESDGERTAHAATGAIHSPRVRALRLDGDRAQYRVLIEATRAFPWEPLRRTAGRLRQSVSRAWLDLDDWAVMGGELEALWRRGHELEPERRRRALGAFASYTEQLAQAGVELLIVPIPLRLELYADRLPGVAERPAPALYSVSRAELFAAAAAQGVEVLPLLAEFSRARLVAGAAAGERLYLDYDTHWTPRGATLAANAIAERVREMEAFEPGPLRPGEDYEVVRGVRPFTYPTGRRHRTELELEFESILDRDGAAFDCRSEASSILLLGDSFANFYREQSADLARLLCARLRQRIDVIGLSGSGGSAWKALARRADPLHGKRIVVWTFTSSTLGDSSFDPLELDASPRK